MRKVALKTTVCILLIIASQLNSKAPVTKATPQTIYVNDDNIAGPWDGTQQHPYQNITNGLSHALDGDTVYAYNGTYSERLIIDKSISLIGENRCNTTIDGNKTGNVIVVTANNVNITHFTIRNSLSVFGYSGIQLQHSTRHNISYNIITNNYEGVWLDNSNSNTLTDNDISNSSEGIYMVDSNNNTLVNDKISNNEFGIVLRNSPDNTVFHSSFMNNTWRAVSSVSSTNSWDNGIEGNYWSDYKGTDENQDGIGDTPYIIDANNQDHYPLVGAFSDFIVVYESETYHVPTICNSTITRFEFNETVKMLDLSAAGPDNTTGFCRITVPQLLVARPCAIIVDNSPVNATVLSTSNATHTILYFAYNHTEREIQILSKPYYELLQKYNTLYQDYQDLNTTYLQLLSDCDVLNQTYQQLLLDYKELQTEHNSLSQKYSELQANHTQLESEYASLSQTYQQLHDNWTRLLADYDTLNQEYQKTVANYTTLKTDYELLVIERDSLTQKYQQALTNITILQANCDNLNQTYLQILNNYTQLRLERNILYQTFQELMTNHTRLQNDYASIRLSYDALLAQYNSLNPDYANTRLALLCVSAAAIAITVTTASLTIKYHRKSKKQEKLAEKYKSELERLSLLDIARSKFEADIERRKGKIQSFERKYGVTIQPRATLEDVIRSLDIKKKREE